jgi:hypothetical protein
MDTLELIKRNRLPRRQKGQRVETRLAWFLRVYINGRQKLIKLADKSDQYRSWSDVQPLIEREISALNNRVECISAQVPLSEFVEQHYMEWVRANKSAPTADSYRKVWSKLSPIIGAAPLANLHSVQVTQVLTAFAKEGLGVRTLSHIKWFLSGVYEYAIANGIVPLNPVPAAKWLLKVKRPGQHEHCKYTYSDVCPKHPLAANLPRGPLGFALRIGPFGAAFCDSVARHSKIRNRKSTATPPRGL